MTQLEFISKVAPAAVEDMRKHRVPASLTIAQAILESGWGTSELATKANNLFGIKGTGPAGTYRKVSPEYVDNKKNRKAIRFPEVQQLAGKCSGPYSQTVGTQIREGVGCKLHNGLSRGARRRICYRS